MNLPVFGIPSFGIPAFGISVFGIPDFGILGFGISVLGSTRRKIEKSFFFPYFSRVFPIFGLYFSLILRTSGFSYSVAGRRDVKFSLPSESLFSESLTSECLVSEFPPSEFQSNSGTP